MRDARRRLGGAAARTVNTGQQLDERTACRLLLMPEGADEGAADRLGGDAERGCGGLLLAAYAGYEQVDHAPFGVGAVGAYAVEQACGACGEVGEVAVVGADADAAYGCASLCFFDGEA